MFEKSLANLLVFIFIFNTSLVNAQSKTSPLTGSCGYVLNRNFGGWNMAYEGSQTVAQNFTGIINFDTGTMYALANTVSNFGKNNAFESQIVDTKPSYISIANGPFTGSYYISESGSATPAFILIPVNGGSTILITELNSTKTTSTGVCQKM